MMLKPCTSPGCRNRSEKGRCEQCRKRQQRTGNARRGTWLELYGPLWPAIRLDYLSRHPWCVLCHRQAQVPDHHPRSLRTLRAAGVANPHADRYLRPLCLRCHSTETATHQPGGWHREQQTSAP